MLRGMVSDEDNNNDTTSTLHSTDLEPIPENEMDLLGELEMNDIGELLDKDDYSLMKLALTSTNGLKRANSAIKRTKIVKNFSKRR